MQEEYATLAKSVDYVSEKQARNIIEIALDKLRKDANAAIAEVWIIEHSRDGIPIIKSFARQSEQGTPRPQDIAVTNDATGLLVWIVEHAKPILINDIEAGSKRGRNVFDDEFIEGRFFNLYERTRAFAAVPVNHRSQLRAILTLETTKGSSIQSEHVTFMNAIAEATGILTWKASVFVENESHTEDAINHLRSIGVKLALPSNPHRTGFIARPFEERFDFIGRSIEGLFRQRQIQATAYRPAPGRSFVVEDMLHQINFAHFGIADITSLNPNVLVEVGTMIGNGKPLVIIKRSDDKMPLPFDIRGRQCYTYEIRAENILIREATTTITLESLIDEFIKGLLRDDTFGNAKPWFGS